MAKILNIDTGKVYSSITAAAKAAGVDPSNVGKVLRGQRRSAGGYRFQQVQADSLTDAQLKDIQRAIEKANPKWLQEQQQRQRYSKEFRRKAALNAIQEDLRAANEAIQDYKKANVYSIGKKVSELVGAGEVIGIRKSGLISTDIEKIKQKLAEADLKTIQAYREQIEKLTQEARNSLSASIQDKSDLADQLGLSKKQIEKYMSYMPEFFALLDLGDLEGRVSSDFIYRTVKSYMQNDIEKSDLRKLFAIIKRFAENENAGDEEDLRKRIDRFEQRRQDRSEKEPKFHI